jgi:hypothetical protein
MFETFDFTELDDPSFKEDAVREEIVAPILRKLGYRPTGRRRVQRSKDLVHPFVMIGSKQHRVYIVPDYTLFLKDKPLAILDAKNPSEPIVNSVHVEQAYSYSIHPEIRCDYYGLCNGRELAMYNVGRWEPVSRFRIQDVNSDWQAVRNALDHTHLQLPLSVDLQRDYGTHARRAGVGKDVFISFLDCPLKNLDKVRDNAFTATADHYSGGVDYLVSLDFDQRNLRKLLSFLPVRVADELREGLGRQPFQMALFGSIIISCHGRLRERVNGAFEDFVPIIVEDVIAAYADPTLVPENWVAYRI